MGAANAVYVEDTFPHLPVAVRVDGKLLPVVSGTEVDVRLADNAITTATVTLFTPGISFLAVASEEAEALRCEASETLGDAK